MGYGDNNQNNKRGRYYGRSDSFDNDRNRGSHGI